MPLPTSLDIEVRATGSDQNAGCFTRTSSGTNLSLAAEGTVLTDIQIHPTDNDKITSSARPPQATDFGNGVRIQQGDNFLAGLYVITAVNNGYWVLHEACYNRVAGGSCSPNCASGMLNVAFHYTAHRIAGLNDGNLVTTWNDCGPSGLTATNLSGSIPGPIYRSTVQNGYPAVEITGSGQHLEVDLTLFPTTIASPGWTIYYVGNPTPTGTIGLVAQTNLSDSLGPAWGVFSFAGPNSLRSGVPTGAAVALFTDDTSVPDKYITAPFVPGNQVLTWVINGTASTGSIYRFGGRLGTKLNEGTYGATYELGLDNLYLLGEGSRGALGRHHEILCFKTAHTDAEILSLSNCLANKYGLTGELPGSGCPATGMVFWFKADALSGTITSGSTFQTWVDSSGNGRHATQPNSNRQFTYLSNTYFSDWFNTTYPTVRTYGRLYGGYATSGFFLSAQHFTLYLVAANLSTTVDGSFFSGGRFLQNDSAADLINLIGTDTGGGDEYTVEVDSLSASFSPVTTGLHCLTLTYNGTAATGQFYVDGVSKGSFSGEVDNNITRAALGGYGPGSLGGASPINGDLCEVILYDITHDPTTIQEMYTCLGRKWGLIGLEA